MTEPCLACICETVIDHLPGSSCLRFYIHCFSFLLLNSITFHFILNSMCTCGPVELELRLAVGWELSTRRSAASALNRRAGSAAPPSYPQCPPVPQVRQWETGEGDSRFGSFGLPKYIHFRVRWDRVLLWALAHLQEYWLKTACACTHAHTQSPHLEPEAITSFGIEEAKLKSQGSPNKNILDLDLFYSQRKLYR